MREYAVLRCRCENCDHTWLEPRRIDREGDPDGSFKAGEWVNTDDLACPECGCKEMASDFTKWKVT